MLAKVITKFKNKKIAIIGFGQEGKSTYRFLRKYFPKLELTILDENEDIIKESILQKDSHVTVVSGPHYLEKLEQYDICMKSPGIVIREEAYHENITSQLEIALEVFRNQIIGVTGTKGKSTISSLLYQVLKDQKKDVYLLGNIGMPIFDELEQIQKNTLCVIEMSSHQLEYVSVSPHIALISNLYEDHLDHAGTIEQYYYSKLNIARYQKKGDIVIYSRDSNNLVNEISKLKLPSTLYAVTLKHPNDGLEMGMIDGQICWNGKQVSGQLKRHLLGEHNLQNIMLVLLCAEWLKLNLEQVLQTIACFQPLENRMERVGTVYGVTYYNDTIATIPEATIQAIEALQTVDTLIFGGMDRGIHYDTLCTYLNNHVAHLICMPTTGHMIGKQLNRDGVYFVDTLKEAVVLASMITQKGKICLLSPAASSYEFFRNYKEKGEYYKKYISEIDQEVSI